MVDRPGRGRVLSVLVLALGLILASGLFPGPDALWAGLSPAPAEGVPAPRSGSPSAGPGRSSPAQAASTVPSDGDEAAAAGQAGAGPAVRLAAAPSGWLSSLRALLGRVLAAGLPVLGGLGGAGYGAPDGQAPGGGQQEEPAPPRAGWMAGWWVQLLGRRPVEPLRLLALGLPALGTAVPPGPGAPAGGPEGQPGASGPAPAAGAAEQQSAAGQSPAAPPAGALPSAGAGAGTGAAAPSGAAPAAGGPAAPEGGDPQSAGPESPSSAGSPPPAAAPPGPLVVVYHTHAREAYGGPGAGKPPKEEAAYSEDPAKTVLRAGAALAEALWRTHGVPALHCPVIHDREGRIGAYLESEATLKRLLAQYRTIRLALDLHRDSQGRKETTIERGGRTLARVMVVLGRGNSNWEANYSLALQLVALMEDRCPGLSRGIFPKAGSYNQHLLPGSLLLEVGGPENTPEEAVATAQVLADLLAELINEHHLAVYGGSSAAPGAGAPALGQATAPAGQGSRGATPAERT
ncbi:MAG: stage II sporulation protein P [Acetobacteraceae bacterium]|nr:stage II sporulation protein P [Acetobacteraceae bacterium]